ncbi:MAG: hypothetical protein ACE5OW_06620 [Candidatus Bathyarchaeia archaeon]
MKLIDLKQRINSLTPNWVILLVVPGEQYFASNLNLLKTLIDELNLRGIYVTVNKPSSMLAKVFEQKGIEVDRLFFIDSVSKMAGICPEETENCIYTDAPSNLTSLQIAIGESIKKVGGPNEEKFLLFDSLSTMLIYNTPDKVSKFSHLFITRLRKYGLNGVIICLEREQEQGFLDSISLFCDETIKIESAD